MTTSQAFRALSLANRCLEARQALDALWDGIDKDAIGEDAYSAMDNAGHVHAFCRESLGLLTILESLEIQLRHAAGSLAGK